MPSAKPGFTTIGSGRGGWIYKPNAGAAGGAKTPTGKGKGGHSSGGASPYSKSEITSARALADAQTKGPLAELANQVAQNNRQMSGALNLTGGYLNSLGGFAKQGVTDEQNIAQGLNTGLGMIGAGQQQALQGIGQNAQTALSKYTPGDPSTSAPAMQALTAELARQQALGAQETTAFKTAGALQGGNYSGLAASALGSDALAGTQALKGIAQSGEVKNEPLNAKIAALRAQAGALYSTDLAKVHQQNIANRYTAQGLGIKQQGADAATANAAAHTTSAKASARNAGTNARNASTNASKVAFDNNPSAVGSAAWARVQSSQGTAWSNNPNAVGSPAWARTHARPTSGGGGGTKPMSTLENNHFWGTIGQMESLVNDAHAKGIHDPTTIKNFLQDGNNPSKKSYDPFLVRVVFELLGYGSIDQSTAAILHNQYGARGGTFRGNPIKVTPNYRPPLFPGVA